ncbi:hypothetical protein [Streptomyces fructofermentans]|uniref:hypothetical protein n=1 Tax=Streptomyces fructofermentans TaxID=152141 RepID=UPI0033F540F9
MALTWRYVVQPDGDLCRVANIDGSLDNTSAEELARLWAGRDKDEQPNRPCSRCGATLLLQWNGPLMTGVWIDWYGDPDRDLTAVARLLEDWEAETMRAHGWARAPQPEAAPGARPHRSLVAPGSGARADAEVPETG